jgi:sugar (pentulose or hexulose) kinase
MAEERWAEDLITGIGLRPEQFCRTVEPGGVIGEVRDQGAKRS